MLFCQDILVHCPCIAAGKGPDSCTSARFQLSKHDVCLSVSLQGARAVSNICSDGCQELRDRHHTRTSTTGIRCHNQHSHQRNVRSSVLAIFTGRPDAHSTGADASSSADETLTYHICTRGSHQDAAARSTTHCRQLIKTYLQNGSIPLAAIDLHTTPTRYSTGSHTKRLLRSGAMWNQRMSATQSSSRA